MGQASSSSSLHSSSDGTLALARGTSRGVDTSTGHGRARIRARMGGLEGDDDEDLSLELPDECLASVFGTLGCLDRNACSLVCRRWCLVDSKSRNRLLLVARFEVSALFPSLLSRFSSVSVLSLKCSRKLVSIDDHSLSLIPSFLPSLKKLKIKGCTQLSDDGLLAFSVHRPPLLSKLSIASCGFGAKGLISLLSNCPSLQDLTLKRLRKLDAENTPLTTTNPSSEVSPEDDDNLYNYDQQRKNLKDYSNCSHQLERLCLKDLHNVRLFIPLLCSTSKSLRTLVISRSSGNWDQVFQILQQQQRISGHLSNYSSSLCDIQMENVQIGDAGLSAIAASNPNLEVFYLSRASDCTNDGLSAIANSCRKLRKVHIDVWTRFGIRTIGDEGVLSLATRCSQLQELVLMGVPVTAASLNALASNCLALERVALCNTESVGDTELALIAAKFSALKKLCIKNCPISSAGIKAIGEGCPNLVKLKVKRCRGITQASVSRLVLQRSKLAVSVDAAGPLLFDGEGLSVAENVVMRGANERNGGSRTGHSAVPNTTRTHVVCGSRTASLLGSKFGSALQLTRRQQNDTSQSRNSTSVRVDANSQAHTRR